MVLAVGLLAMLVCLALQAGASMFAIRHFARAARRPVVRLRHLTVFQRLAGLMIALMLGNVVQIGIWALLYRAFGALQDWESALYFSGVTFTSLGYGDIVLHGQVRLLAPLQAANGLMMFGVTTAVVIAAVQRAIETWSERKADLGRVVGTGT